MSRCRFLPENEDNLFFCFFIENILEQNKKKKPQQNGTRAANTEQNESWFIAK